MAQPNQPDLATILNALRDEMRALGERVDNIQQPIQPVQPQQPPQQPQAPHLGHVVNIKPDRPPPFHGKKSESLEAWIFQMEQYCELLPVPEANRIAFTATFLKDNAALWWRSYFQSIDWNGANAPDWNEFLAAIRQQFVPVNTTHSAYDRLHRLKQHTSVNQYNHAFREIMLELPHIDAATKLHFYIQGLKDHVRPLVALQQPQNLAAAEAIAERVDAVTFQTKNRTPGPRYNHNSRTPGGTTSMELDAISKLTPAERERLRKEGGCFRCRKPGHLARDCPLPNRQNPRLGVITDETDESGKE